MESLSLLTGKQYYTCYSVFKQNVVGKSCTLYFLHLPTIIRSMLQETKELSQFNILSIGSGDGTEDITVVKIVEEELQRIEKYRDVKIFMRGIEPNEYFKSLYDKTIEELTGSLKTRSVFDVRGNTFEEYMDQNDDLRFDLVVFTHSMYYLDEEKSLKYCFDKLLKGNGKVLVTLDISWILTSVEVDEERDNSDSFEMVMKAVDKNKWRSAHVTDEYEVDVTKVFDAKSEEGILLLDFLVKKVDFREKAEKEQLDHVMKQLEENATLKNGKRFGKVAVRMFIISR